MLNNFLAGSTAHTLPNPLSSLLVFQAGPVDSAQMNRLVLFVGIAAISLAVVALFFLLTGIGALIAYKEATKEIGQLRKQANELIARSQSLIAEFTPQIRQITAKVDTITAHVEHLAALVHEKADEISPTVSAANQTVLEANETVRETIRSTSATVQDANNKTRAQISRVDRMVSSALDATVRLGVAIEQGVAKPGREVAGVIAGLKAGLDVFAGAASRALKTRPASSRTAEISLSPLRSVSERPQPIYPVSIKRDSDV